MTNRQQNLSLICNRFCRDIGTRFVVIRCMEMKNKTILVVDDEPDIREILVFNLEQEGYRCLQASCGQEALCMAKDEHVDLVLLDIMMPNMSGLEVAEVWQKEENSPALIFLTALGEEEDVLRGFELGADDYIHKPFSLKQVLARVAAVIRRHSSVDVEDSNPLRQSYLADAHGIRTVGVHAATPRQNLFASGNPALCVAE